MKEVLSAKIVRDDCGVLDDFFQVTFKDGSKKTVHPEDLEKDPEMKEAIVPLLQ